MRVPGRPSAHLTYCLNVHPGETWDENLKAIEDYALRVREQVAPRQPFGLGLRLSRRAAESLRAPAALASFREYLKAHDLYAITVNGFPYGEFHGKAVKEDVYRPDWRSVDRLDYTTMLADVLAELLPDGVGGSISTLPGSYKAWIRTEADRSAMVTNLAECVAHLAELYNRTGREICLGLEPEPDCFVEATPELVDFLSLEMREQGVRQLAARLSCSAPQAQEAMRRHLGVCLDTCHVALQFEPLEDSLALLGSSGIRICKVQISAALECEGEPSGLARLKAFSDSIYLHQVKTRGKSGEILSRGDLPIALASASGAPVDEEWRVHCHVPLYFEGEGDIGTTASELTPSFFMRAADSGVEHFEIETYTLGILPESVRRRDLVESIVDEYKWVLRRFEQHAS